MTGNTDLSLKRISIVPTSDGPKICMTDTGQDVTSQIKEFTYMFDRGAFVGAQILTVEQYERQVKDGLRPEEGGN